MRSALFLFLATILMFQTACSQKKLSVRDRELQDRQRGVDLKKAELSPLAGEYEGLLLGTNNYRQTVKLMLEVRDVPQNEGKPDSLLIPKLLGTLRFYFGEMDSTEYIDAAVKTSEYIKVSNQLSLVVEHAQFGQMAISGTADGETVTGTWNAAAVGANGTLQVKRIQP